MQQEITHVLDEVLEPIERHVLGLGSLAGLGRGGEGARTRRQCASQHRLTRRSGRVDTRRRPALVLRAAAALERAARPAEGSSPEAVRTLLRNRS